MMPLFLRTDLPLDYSDSEVPLSDLIRLAHEHEELYPKLVDTVKKYIKVFERKDVDE